MAKARFALRRKQAQVPIHGGSSLGSSRRRATSQTAYSFNMSAVRSLAPSTSGMLSALLVQKCEEILKYPRDSKDRLAPRSRLFHQPRKCSPESYPV